MPLLSRSQPDSDANPDSYSNADTCADPLRTDSQRGNERDQQRIHSQLEYCERCYRLQAGRIREQFIYELCKRVSRLGRWQCRKPKRQWVERQHDLLLPGARLQQQRDERQLQRDYRDHHCAHANSNSYSNANTSSDSHSDSNANPEPNAHANSDAKSYTYTYTYAYANCNADTDAKPDTEHNAHADCDAHAGTNTQSGRNAQSNRNSDCDSNSIGNTNTKSNSNTESVSRAYCITVAHTNPSAAFCTNGEPGNKHREHQLQSELDPGE
jgi:hypothetical protein